MSVTASNSQGPTPHHPPIEPVAPHCSPLPLSTLRDVALARSGDKGNRATLTVIALDLAHFPLLEQVLTTDAVRVHYAGVVLGEVQRYTLPHVGAVHFVLHDALAGGVTRSLALDAHGKTLAAAVLALPLPFVRPPS